MKSTSNLKHIPAWQTERSAILQRACRSINAAIQRGEKISKAIQRESRRHHGQPFKSDARHRMALAPETLRQLWDKWRHGGKSVTVFKLGYRARVPQLPRMVMLRFVEFCAVNRLSSMRIAWLKFSGRKENCMAREFSYSQVAYIFTAADFYRMQQQLRWIDQAQAALDQIKRAAVAQIAERLPLHQ